MRLIDADKLKEHKFVGNKFVQIGGRTNGKTLESINKAYKLGWNDCIDAIIDNAPTVPQGERSERALSIIGRLRTDGHINNKEQGTLRRAILLPERPHGKWIEDSGNIACSHCHTIWLYRRTDFCPNCGADMREVSNDG